MLHTGPSSQSECFKGRGHIKKITDSTDTLRWHNIRGLKIVTHDANYVFGLHTKGSSQYLPQKILKRMLLSFFTSLSPYILGELSSERAEISHLKTPLIIKRARGKKNWWGRYKIAQCTPCTHAESHCPTQFSTDTKNVHFKTKFTISQLPLSVYPTLFTSFQKMKGRLF